ncbi:MAG: trypsin-like peptidase domain-containing protein [Patescibacteria group bacterium]|nr:trypsin-like peptidase domain-containing protein [Patescibacteria group bacterium]
MYKLPEYKILLKLNKPKKKLKKKNIFFKNKVFHSLILTLFLSCFFGFLAGALSGAYFYVEIKKYISDKGIEKPLEQIIKKETIIEKITEKEYIPQTTQEEKIISVVEKYSPAVVNIVITKDMPIIEEYYFSPFNDDLFQIPQYREKGMEKKEIGGGSGFIVSADGMILTNKHVVLDETADYMILTNNGEKYTAEILGKDPLQDIALLKIDGKKIFNEQGEIITEQFPFVKLGDSSSLKIGQSVVAIGNALGQFKNTVSLGVVSGLGRTITASNDAGFVETLENVIQTDAAINKGNSGGPLLNLMGEVIGMNTAMAQGLAENIGFAISINKAKKDIEQIKTLGKIVYPFLGIHYVVVSKEIQEQYELPVDYGVLIISKDANTSAIFPESAAEKIGLKDMDIILEFDDKKITLENSLAKIIMEYNPNDRVKLKILEFCDLESAGEEEYKEKFVWVALDERE